MLIKGRTIGKKEIIGFVTKLSIYFLLICISYVYLLPILRMVSSVFMSEQDIIDPSVEWLPKFPSLRNVVVSAHVLDIPKTLLNSIWFSGLLAVCQTAVSALTGFSFARFNFRFKKMWFVVLVGAFIMPVPILVVSRLMIFTVAQDMTGIKLVGTLIPQVAMAALGQGVNATVLVLIFYNFFRMIPYSLDESAMIDGATTGQVFYHIILKLSLTTILVVFLFSFVWNWNETYQTGTFLRSGISLLPLRLAVFDSIFGDLASGATPGGFSRLNEAYKLTATFISILPMLILYMFVQKQFIVGIENAGITGE